jgi:hypothetical protein
MPDTGAMRNGHYRTPLQRERYLRGWTLQEVVDRVERLSWELDQRELGLSVNTVSRWERGVIAVPYPPYPRLLAVLYGKPVAELFPTLHKPVATAPGRPVLPSEVWMRSSLAWRRSATPARPSCGGPPPTHPPPGNVATRADKDGDFHAS